MKSHLLLSKVKSATFETVDLMDPLWDFFEQTQALSIDEKIRFFKSNIIEPNLSYYSCVFGINDDALRHYITETEPKIARLHSSQRLVLDQYDDLLRSFQEQFPNFQTNFTVYLLPSLNLFKGIAAPSQEKIMLLLGIDALAELAENHRKGYLTHELFHVYHFQRSPAVRIAAELAIKTMKMPQLWGLLWTEGLACHAIRAVYPEIQEEEILDWSPLVNQTRPLLSELAMEARRVLTSDSSQDIAGFFYFPRGDNSNIPTGCGYYIGMLVADALAKRYSIDTLIRMSDEILIPEIDSALLTIQE